MVALQGHGQRWEEWFRQKETALRYSAAQIAALRSYADALQKGYAIAREGLDAIDAIKKGDFLQHLAYITGLRQVNPKVAGSGNVSDMLSLHEQTRLHADRFRDFIAGEAHLDGAEKNYGREVFRRVESTAAYLSGQLNFLLREGLLEMDDVERLERIRLLLGEMESLYRFARHFGEGFRQLAAQRRQVAKEEKVLRQFGLQ